MNVLDKLTLSFSSSREARSCYGAIGIGFRRARAAAACMLRGHHREPGLDERIVDAALAAHCTDVTKPRTERSRSPEYRLYTAR